MKSFCSVVFLINRLPSKDLIPYKQLFNKEVDYTFLRVLGCLCYPLTRPYNQHKLELRAKECAFIGYGINQKGYKCLHIPTGRVYISRNVRFVEDEFPFAHMTSSLPVTEQTPPTSNPLILLHTRATFKSPASIPIQIAAGSTSSPTSVPPPLDVPSAHNPPIQSSDPAQISLPTDPPLLLNPLLPPAPPEDPNPQGNGNQLLTLSSPIAPSSTSQELSQTPVVRASSSSAVPNSSIGTHTMITRTKAKTYKQKEYPDFISYHVAADSDPTTFTQANKLPHWRAAMANELTALANNKTWTLVPPPLNQKIIGCKWVFKTKRKSDGSVERHKARLVIPPCSLLIIKTKFFFC